MYFKVSLSSQIFTDTPTRFFAVLTWRYGKLYVDALDEIEKLQRVRHGTGISRVELISICEKIIISHQDTQFVQNDDPTIPVEEKENSLPSANEMLRLMLKCEWLEEPIRSDFKKVYYLDSRAELLLESLRRIAYPEQITFTDKLHLVCKHLLDKESFIEHPLSDLESCVDNLRYGLQELRSMQQSVSRLTQRQLKSDTLKENLQVLYDDFAENIGQKCYKSLISLNIPLRMPLVKQSLVDIESNPIIVTKMEVELSKRRPDLEEFEVSKVITRKFSELKAMLDSVEPQTDAIDRRAADFARRSFARFRYLQEVSSGRQAELRQVFEIINAQYSGQKMAKLQEIEDFPKLNIPSIKLISGIDSLSLPVNRKQYHTERTPLTETYSKEDQGTAVDEMQDNINSSLTSLRANHYFHQLNIPQEGLNAKDLPTNNPEWLLELAGLLLHGETSNSKYQIKTPREADKIPQTHPAKNYLIDDFSLSHKKQ